LNWRGAGKPPETEEAVGPTPGLTPQQQAEEQARLTDIQNRPRWNPAADAKMLGQARTLYLTGAIAAFASVRIVAGLLLALGPLFVLFLLFDSTRGLFEGWIRGLAGAALGALATTIVLGVQLALLEPWLAFILTQRRFNVATPGVPVEMLVTNLVFALVVIAALAATARVAAGFRIPDRLRAAPGRWVEALRPAAAGAGAMITVPAGGALPSERPDERPRAYALADSVAAAQRRESAGPAPAPAQLASFRVGEAAGRTAARDMPAAMAASGHTDGYRRRTRSRVSAAAGRRDSSR
jgi:type IV secretion system protein VirB6